MQTEYFQLQNGMWIISHHDPTSPLIHISMDIKVGASVDSIPGIAHVCEHLLFTGTQNFPDYDQVLLEHGATNNAWTAYDNSNFHCTAPPESLPKLLEVEADRLANVSEYLNETVFQTEKSVVFNEMNESFHDDPYHPLMLEEYASLFGPNHPYGHPIIGLHDDLEKIELETVRAFLKEWYQPANATLLIAGGFDRQILSDALDTHMKPLVGHESIEQPQPFPPQRPFSTHTQMYVQASYGYVGLDWILPPISSSILIAANILCDILSAAQYGLLYRDIELDLRWASEVETDLYAMKIASVFSISAVVHEELHREKVKNRILYHLDRIANGLLDPLLLKKSKKKFKLYWLLQHEDIEERVERYQEWLRFHANLSGLKAYTESFQQVTMSELQGLARHLLSTPYLTLDGFPKQS
ncbi:MAG: pitrilysin family protein [Myxococcota bacterium]|nr:pitrilysin family protein [Myxococcota bacterium]